mgnify:FL=1
MKQTTGAEAVPLPPRKTVRVLGRDIPVSDFTVGETIELERILHDPPQSAVEQNVACVAVLIRHRLGEAVDVDALMREPIGDLAAFEEAVNELLAPFTKSLLAAVIARRGRLMTAIKSLSIGD